MKRLLTILALIFTTICCKAQTPQPGAITATVYTGTPVLISLNKMEDYDNGKQAYYSTIIRFSFSSVTPELIKLFGKTSSDYFDGPESTLSCKNLKCSIDKITVDGLINDISSCGQIYYSGHAELNSNSIQICNFKITDSKKIGKPLDIYLHLRFAVSSNDNTHPIKSYKSGYYYIESCFWMQTE
jgi:hypothetical protein